MKCPFALLTLSAVCFAFASCGDDEEPIEIQPNPDPDPTPEDSGSVSVSNACAGWPADYGGVMLQGFYWDSYTDSQWSYLESQAEDIAPYFSLIWIPNSGNCGSGNSMGYLPLYFFNQQSSFGSEAQLRSLIQTYKDKGTGMIADVVINHHNSQSGWFDFPAETYNGQTYQFTAQDVCKDDDGGKAATEALAEGVSLSSNADTGEGWDGCRDLDHNSANVQRYCLAYLDFLKNDLGYAGFRYDMVKGYSSSFTALYNDSINPRFSVGEYWDGNHSTVERWMQNTTKRDSIQSGAFDFAFRYTCRDAVNNNKWSYLLNETSATSLTYQRYAVTFVENHDTEYRSASAQQDPIKKDTLAVNAWLLANPGTPCVFYKHWQAYKREIKLMIAARQLVGITNQSGYANRSNGINTYAARQITGSNGKLIVVVGPQCGDYAAPDGFTELISGYHYRYLVSSDCDTSGWSAIVSRINEEEQTAPFEAHTATVYVKADFSPVYFYIWDSNDNTQLNGAWPGKLMTETIEKAGEMWYTQTVSIDAEGYYFNIIFNQGSGKPQTSDIGHISSDKYFVATLSGSTINYTDVTSQYAGQ